MSIDPVPTAVVRGKLPPFEHASGPLPEGVTVIPTYPMYSSGQVALATFLGGPVGGSWLIAQNFKRMRQPGHAMTLILGIVGTALLLAAAVALPAFPRWTSLALVGLMSAIARGTQGDAYRRHLELGGPRASSWTAAGVGLISLVVLAAVLIGGAVGFEYLRANPKVDFGHDHEVYYAEGTTREEAQAVGDELVRNGYFAAAGPATVQVEHAADRHVVSFVVQAYVFSDDASQDAFYEMTDKLSKAAFHGEPLDLQLTDEYLTPKVVLRWDSRPQRIDLGGGSDIWFQHGATEAEARAVSAILVEGGYFLGKPGSVMVTRNGRLVVGFYVRGGIWDDKASRDGYHKWASELSPAFAGAPVDVWLLATDGTPKGKLLWEDRPRDP